MLQRCRRYIAASDALGRTTGTSGKSSGPLVLGADPHHSTPATDAGPKLSAFLNPARAALIRRTALGPTTAPGCDEPTSGA